jgi:uncharacterized membrane protein
LIKAGFDYRGIYKNYQECYYMVTIAQMNFRKILILTALLITATGVATASQAEMTVFPSESSTRIDSFTSYELTVENVGPVEDTYTFTSSSVQEIDVAPQKVTLGAGEEETVNVWYNPSPQREEGTYSFSITAESRATGDSYSTDIVASVIREHDVSLETAPAKTVCRGDTAVYNVEVTNDGIQKEQFALTTEYGQLSTDSVTLEDGETQTVTLTASSDTPVTENFNVKAASTTSYAQSIQNVQFNVETCYASQTSITPTDQRTAAGTTTEFDVTVQNTGTKEDTFALSSNMGEFSDNTLEIDGKSSETATLEITPEQLGTSTVTVNSRGSSNSSATANLEVYNGNDMEIQFQNQARTVCETEDSVEVDTRLVNTGETEETFSVQTSLGTSGLEEVTLEPGDAETFTTVVDATELEEGTSYSVTTSATATTFGEPTKSGTVDLNVENCWDVSMNVVPEVMSAGENRSVIYEVNLENTGARENTYELAYEGPEWVSIQPGNLTVAAGETGTSYMYAGIPFKKEGNVQITATAVGTNATDSQKVELVIGQDIEEAIRDGDRRGNGITGQFSQALQNIQERGPVVQALLAILVAAIITAAILVREW